LHLQRRILGAAHGRGNLADLHGLCRGQVQSPVRARRVHRLSQWHLLFALRGCQCGHLRCLPYPFFIFSRCVWYIITSSHRMCPCVCICLCVWHIITAHHHIACHIITSRTLRLLSVCVAKPAHTHVCACVCACE
jgi:hypothetical protein